MPQQPHPDLDVAIVGGGFSGIYALYKLREAGFKVRGYERKRALGGVWRENAYPGAGVDSQSPFYQFYDARLLQDWTWSEEYPSQAEMGQYFDHVDRVWHVSKDFELNVELQEAHFCEEMSCWKLQFTSGNTASARWFLPAVGFSSVTSFPNIPGIDSFAGQKHHTALWPDGGVGLEGKRVAVIGTGPSGVQIIQAAGKMAKEMVVYQRTAPLTLPKFQATRAARTAGSVDDQKGAFERSLHSFSAFDYALESQDTFGVSNEDRLAFYKKRHGQGGWSFWMSAYHDMWYDTAANMEAYAFWADTTRKRIKDDRKRDLLIPSTPERPFGIKRPCLEEDLYEVLDQPNVDIVDISQQQIERITPEGIRVNGELREFDVIVLATGFGGETSGLTHLNIRGTEGLSLKDTWDRDVRSHLGLALRGFPNLFYLYGPQCPTLLVNSPAVITVQVDWICELMSHLRDIQVTRIEATRDAETYWYQRLYQFWSKSLYALPPPWNGTCKGQKAEKPPTWIGGLPAYRQELWSCAEQEYCGFDKR